jgi:hypothetical protein
VAWVIPSRSLTWLFARVVNLWRSKMATDKHTAAADQARTKISELADNRSKLAVKAQKHIDGLAVVLAEMLDAGDEIDRLARSSDLRNHLIGQGFATRVCQSVGPCFKRLGILAHIDSSHPKFGLPMTVGEGDGADALIMLDRARKMESQNQARRDATQKKIYGDAA